MFIRENWGTEKQCRIGSRICIAHETITNLNAPVFQEGMHTNKWSELIIHLSGNVSYGTGFHTYNADTLDIFSVNTDETYFIDWDRTSPYERFTVYFDNDLFEDIFPDEADYKAVLSFLDHKKRPNLLKLADTFKDELTALLNSIEPKLGSNDSDANISVFASLMRMFDLVYRATSASNGPASTGSNNLISNTLQLVDQQYKEINEIGAIAEKLHVSPEYLSKRFKASMGVSLKNYLLDKKLQYSRRLLRLGYNVTEASAAAGFSSSSYFIQLYKKKYGVTPGKE